MRFLYFLFLVAFAGAAGVFAWQNQQELSLQFFQYTATANVALVVGVTYVLGMLSGWTIVGMLRRSFQEVQQFAGERLQTPSR